MQRSERRTVRTATQERGPQAALCGGISRRLSTSLHRLVVPSFYF